MKKSIFFGGTFDPVHNGHLALAREILQKGYGSQVLFVPAAVLPHTYKSGEAVTPFFHRFAMLERAIAGEEGFALSDIENQREGKSYTLETLRLLRSQGVWGDPVLLIGADSLLKLHTWKDAHLLVKEFDLLVYPRKGSVLSSGVLEEHWNRPEQEKLLSSVLPEMKEFDISSTRIREIMQKGSSSEETLLPFVKKEVLRYITEEGLYS